MTRKEIRWQQRFQNLKKAYQQLKAGVEQKTLGFEFPNFQSAWEALALVTTAHSPDKQLEAQQAVKDLMYSEDSAPRRFSNRTQFIIGQAGT